MSDTLPAGSSLPVDGRLQSADGRFVLVMQGDANLVMYRVNGAARWASNTAGRAFGRCDMQGDGNLVIYDPAGHPLWASGTSGHPGARLVMQDDGNLVIYDAGGRALWASSTVLASRRVPGFRPSVNGFGFANSFPNTPDWTINVLGQNVAIGNAANGLCGGMTYAVRDIFMDGRLPPAGAVAPSSGPLFDFIARRLMDSFELPVGPLRYLAQMSPALSDHETTASQTGLAPHGRAWAMIRDEWPRIRAEIDLGHLVNLALVRVKSANPGDMGHNHQVLVWGYDLDGNQLDLRFYDPNHPGRDDALISLNIADPMHTTPVRYPLESAPTDLPVFSFFQTAWRFVMPPNFAPVVPPQSPAVTVINRTRGEQTVRVYSATDLTRGVALTAGEFVLGVRDGVDNTGAWTFPPGVTSVQITANGRPQGLMHPGNTWTLTQDDRVMIVNTSLRVLVARFYRVGDTWRVATLPDGDRRVSPQSDLAYTVPAGLNQVQLVLDGGGSRVLDIGATVTVSA
jgi:hypothetical protein